MIPLIPSARDLAVKAHEGLKSTTIYGFTRPQALHLQEVADLVWASGGTEEEIAAAWLHDTVEDTSVTIEDVEKRFGNEVAKMVSGLTDQKEIVSLPITERKQKQADHIKSESPSVRRIKIADQASNVRLLAIDTTTSMTPAECKDYIEGAKRVAEACQGVSSLLDKLFDEAYQMGKKRFA